jgi:hypothetical protein
MPCRGKALRTAAISITAVRERLFDGSQRVV